VLANRIFFLTSKMPTVSIAPMTQDWKQLRGRSTPSEEFPLSMANGRMLLIRAYETGIVETTEHIKQRGIERNFTNVDVENVVRNGQIVGKPKFNPHFENWCFVIRGKIEGKVLEVRVGLAASIDYDSPLLTLITGIRKGASNAKGDDDEK
jgi:hypothetical protein